MYLSEENKRQNHINSGFCNLDRNENHDIVLNKQIRKILKQINTPLFYPSYNDFVVKLSKFLKIKKENILLTCGCSEAIKISFSGFINNNTKVLTYTPTYMYAVDTLKSLTAHIFNLKYSEDPIKIIKQKNISFFYICNPNNPTGDYLSKEKLESIIDFCYKNNCAVFIDEAYFEYCGITVIKYVNKYPNLIVGRTFSKAWSLAGERVGYIVASKAIINTLKSSRLKASTPSLGVYLASELLDKYNLILSSVNRMKKDRRFLIDYIVSKGGIIISKNTTNFLYFKAKYNIFKGKKIIYRKLYNNYCISVIPQKLAKKILH